MVPDMRTGLVGRIEIDIRVPPEFEVRAVVSAVAENVA